MTKWRRWAKLAEEPQSIDPRPGYAWVPVKIDVYGSELQVLEERKIDNSSEVKDNG